MGNGWDYEGHADNLSLSVTVNYDMVSVSSQSKGTNYAQFLKNYSEIYAFTGTPKYVAETFEIVYGIRMGASDVNQADIVFGNLEGPLFEGGFRQFLDCVGVFTGLALKVFQSLQGDRQLFFSFLVVSNVFFSA